MARQIKNVALTGATGNVGSRVLEALVKTGVFKVTVLARKPNTTLPASVTVKVVDFGSVNSLTESLKGIDALVDAAGSPDPSVAMCLIEAAAAAGVYRVIPAEFSADPKNTDTRSLPVFQGKAQVFSHLEKLAGEGKITYTSISNGAFMDWSLRTGFVGIDLKDKTVKLMNDGTHVFPWTHLEEVGKAVANALLVPEKTKNRICFIYNILKSQKDVIDLAKDALGADGWKTETRDMNTAYADALIAVKTGDFSYEVMADLIRYSISTPGFSSPLDRNDNELLGVRQMSDEEVGEVIREIAKEAKDGPH